MLLFGLIALYQLLPQPAVNYLPERLKRWLATVYGLIVLALPIIIVLLILWFLWGNVMSNIYRLAVSEKFDVQPY